MNDGNFYQYFAHFTLIEIPFFLLYDLLKVSSTFLLVNLHIWIEWKYNIYRNACKDLALVWFGFKEATNLNVIQNVSLFCENFFFDWLICLFLSNNVHSTINYPSASFIHSFSCIWSNFIWNLPNISLNTCILLYNEILG